MDDHRVHSTTQQKNGSKPKTVGSPLDDRARREAALKRCDKMIEWYDEKRDRARIYYRLFHTSTIVLTGLTPVLILSGSVAPIVQAVPPAIAALFAALIAAYRWREDWIRYTVSAETLRSERTKYMTRTTADYCMALPAAIALDTFVFRMETVAASEIAEWRNQQAQKTESSAEDQGGQRLMAPAPAPKAVQAVA